MPPSGPAGGPAGRARRLTPAGGEHGQRRRHDGERRPDLHAIRRGIERSSGRRGGRTRRRANTSAGSEEETLLVAGDLHADFLRQRANHPHVGVGEAARAAAGRRRAPPRDCRARRPATAVHERRPSSTAVSPISRSGDELTMVWRLAATQPASPSPTRRRSGATASRTSASRAPRSGSRRWPRAQTGRPPPPASIERQLLGQHRADER